jgi:hypothetical protein
VLLPGRQRAAPAKKRKQSTIAGNTDSGFAAVERLQLSKGSGILLNPIGKFEQRKRALLWRRLAPAFECSLCGGHRSIDLIWVCLAHACDCRASRWIDDGFFSTLPGGELAVDQ